MMSSENKSDLPAVVKRELGEKKFDESRFTLDNLDDLTEEELYAFEKKWKSDHLPTWRAYMLIPYHLIIGGGLYYYAKNFKHISKTYFKPKKYSLWEIVKYGTVQSVIFLSFYIPGNGLVTGLWHPIDYMRGLSKIKGKILDNQVRFDEGTQDSFLFEVMKSFGISQTILENAKKDLAKQKEELEQKGYFMKKKTDDDDDDEEEEEVEEADKKKETK